MTKSEVRLCPQCASATVNYSELEGGNARCRGCRWEGPGTELLSLPIQHDFISDESVAISMMNELRGLFAGSFGVPYLKFLLKWGFLEGDINDPARTVDRKKFARYIAAIGRGVLSAIFEEREKQAVRAAAERMPS